MTTERHSWSSGAKDAEIEDLLRKFYAAEMPADLRRSTVAQTPPASPIPSAGARDSAALRAGRGLGLTAVAASLMLAASAFVLATRGMSPAGRSGTEGGGSPANIRSSAAANSDNSVPRGPVELQGAAGGSLPASATADDRPDDDFPEFDIRILPIDQDRR